MSTFGRQRARTRRPRFGDIPEPARPTVWWPFKVRLVDQIGDYLVNVFNDVMADAYNMARRGEVMLLSACTVFILFVFLHLLWSGGTFVVLFTVAVLAGWLPAWWNLCLGLITIYSFIVLLLFIVCDLVPDRLCTILEFVVSYGPEAAESLRQFTDAYARHVATLPNWTRNPDFYVVVRGNRHTFRSLVRPSSQYTVPESTALFCMALLPNPFVLILQIFFLAVVAYLVIFQKLASAAARTFVSIARFGLLAVVCFTLCLWADESTLDQYRLVLTTFLTWWWWAISNLVRPTNWGQARRSVRLVSYVLMLKAIKTMMYLDLLVRRHRGGKKSFANAKTKVSQLWNNSFLAAQRVIDQMSLPEFVRSAPAEFDSEAIRHTNEVLESLGWPATVAVQPEAAHVPGNVQPPPGWTIGRFDFAQGIHNLRLTVDHELRAMAALAPTYMRSEQYATFQNELEATARYFTEVEYEFPDTHLDDVWPLVAEIFSNSELTPFNFIVKKWEKRYGLGAQWKDPDSKRDRKLSRRKAIKMMGGIPSLLKSWAETFKWSVGLTPVSAVSVKGEALPPKKWLADKVRTVVGSPLTHYIMTTVFNYAPNHNFKWATSPIKIGMPLNGANLSQLWSEHATYDVHFAGDMTAFDSTVSGKVEKMIREVRKRGFQGHKDFNKIAFLIDASYDQLRKTPLATTSTGNIYRKGTGLSTGHSSTSMDNSLALVITYMMIWKDVTGLSVHEFKYYCKLSCYGDDHVLSWMKAAPSSWTKTNIMKSAARMGFTLRDEEPSGLLTKIAFLSKRATSPSTADKTLFEKLGMPVPSFIVYHETAKLIGKMCAPVKSMDRDYRVKRLISYLYLTAHQEDVYRETKDAIVRILNGRESKWPIPTYEDVIRKWYDPKSNFVSDVKLDETATFTNDDEAEAEFILSYSARGPLEVVAAVLSVVPDLLNPAIFNTGYTTWLINRFGSRIYWPFELLKRANGTTSVTQLKKLLSRTPYDPLVTNAATLNGRTDDSWTKLLICHWIFLVFRWRAPGGAGPMAWTNSVTRGIVDLQFALNARVATFTVRLTPPIWDLCLVAALSYMPNFAGLDWLWHVQLPLPANLVDQFSQALLAQLWSRVPANFKLAIPVVEKVIETRQSGLIIAKTGVGKSTTMVAFLRRHLAGRFDKVVVIVPRALLAHSIPPYVNEKFGMDATPLTHGALYDPSAHVVYCTPAELFLHEELLTGNNFFMLDECHLEEPVLNFVELALTSLKQPLILTTATPRGSQVSDAVMHVELPIAQVWTVTDHVPPAIDLREVRSYEDWWVRYRTTVLDIIASAHPATKFLVFVVDKSQAAWLADRCPTSTCVLSSSNRVIDPKALVTFATAVADVGITLPDVDWVITSDLSRTVELGGDLNSYNSLHRINDRVIQQRRGRGGRTSNSNFTLLSTFGTPNWTSPTGVRLWREPRGLQRSLVALGCEILAQGVPATAVAQFMPGFITEFVEGKGYSRSSDPLLDAFVANVGAFNSALQAGPGESHFTSVVDTSGSVPPPYVSHGNRFVKGADDCEGEAQFLSAWEMSFFVLASAGAAAKRGKRITRDDAHAFVRSSPINGASFMANLMSNFAPAMNYMRTQIERYETSDDHALGRFSKASAGHHSVENWRGSFEGMDLAALLSVNPADTDEVLSDDWDPDTQ